MLKFGDCYVIIGILSEVLFRYVGMYGLICNGLMCFFLMVRIFVMIEVVKLLF